MDENNEYYSSVDGILFNKEKDEIILYPPAKSDITTYTIPTTVTTIKESAFANNKYLTDVEIPSSVTSIGTIPSGTFGACSKLSAIEIPEGVTSIGSGAFYGSGIENIVLPSTLVEIQSDAFTQTPKLKHIKIPEGVTKIAASTFYFGGLNSIEIPRSLTTIGNYAFYSNGGLRDVYYAGSAEEFANINIGTSGNSSFTGARKHYNYTGD